MNTTPRYGLEMMLNHTAHGSQCVLAIDIGGTKMACGIVDSRGAILTSGSVPTRRDVSGDELFNSLMTLVNGVIASWDESPEQLEGVGVGCGGPMSAGGETVSPLAILPWREFPLGARLGGVLNLPIFVDNDAKALALGEGWIGAAAGRGNYIAMVVSTGVGGGIVLDGRMLEGVTGNAGHIGHVVVVPEGRPCHCGGQGCLEAEASGRAIERITGAPAARATHETKVRTGRLVGQALASTMNLLDVDFAVIAGSVALGFGDIFFDAAQGEIDRLATIGSASAGVVQRAGLGAQGPLVGAAAVCWRHLGWPQLRPEPV